MNATPYRNKEGIATHSHAIQTLMVLSKAFSNNRKSVCYKWVLVFSDLHRTTGSVSGMGMEEISIYAHA